MALRGKKPEQIEKRLKVLFYGMAGSGKTMASIQFPNPYLIDTEKGAENAQYVELLNASNGAIFQTSDFDEMIIEIKSLLSEKHNFKTLIIDPLTTVYTDLLEKAEKEVGTQYGRHYGIANTKMKHMLNLLLRLDMNVIVTSHAKNEYGENLAVLGQTFDCYKKLDYLFDLVIEVQKRGLERVGFVKKSRLKSFAESEVFPFSYDEISMKYGSDILIKEAIPEELATPEQVAEVEHLTKLLQIPEEVQHKWLTKARASSFEEMEKDKISLCIDFMKKKIEGEKDEENAS
jgi:hypothetical protein